jgi:hypothetical protein
VRIVRVDLRDRVFRAPLNLGRWKWLTILRHRIVRGARQFGFGALTINRGFIFTAFGKRSCSAAACKSGMSKCGLAGEHS